jgi:hypothetical protein
MGNRSFYRTDFFNFFGKKFLEIVPQARLKYRYAKKI